MGHQLLFTDQQMVKDYELIPEDVKHKFKAHFEKVASAKSLRGLPYPAHANRGVTVREQNYEVSASVHVARTRRDGEIEVLGVNVRFLTDEESYFAGSIRECPCPRCGVGKGEPCRVPSQWKYKRAHEERIKVYEHHIARTQDATVYRSKAVASVVCTNCGSGVGQGCRTPAGWNYPDLHAERLDLYRKKYC